MDGTTARHQKIGESKSESLPADAMNQKHAQKRSTWRQFDLDRIYYSVPTLSTIDSSFHLSIVLTLILLHFSPPRDRRFRRDVHSSVQEIYHARSF